MTVRTKFFAAFAVAALVGCGGGSGGGQQAGIDRTGNPVPAAASFGTVTAFGSIVVNGVRYDTSSTTFTIDGGPGAQSDLAVGDVVLVSGTVDASGVTGVATTVVADDRVEGPIEAAPNLVAGTFVVLGQTVRVTTDTSFDDRIQPPSLAGLAAGAIVEVAGLVESDGSIHATRIEPKAAGTELELTGTVAAHDSVNKRFNVNGQVVDYSAVSQLQNFPAAGVANGQVVEIKGGAVTAGVWRPTRIELQANPLAGATGARREVEGFITRFGSASDFTVAGLNVTTSAQTIVSGGTLANLGLNVKVEVEGALDAAGALVATKVDIRRTSAVRVLAVVDSVDAAAGSFVVLGITVRADALTRFEDKSSQQQRPFNIGNLVAGNYVEVRGSEQPAGEILAAIVERDNVDTETELRGFVQSIAQPNFTILGVSVATTNAGTQFRALNGGPLSAAQFFTELGTGDLVGVKGLELGPRALQADEAELEN